MKQYYSDQQKQEIITEFKNGKSVSELQKQYNISNSTLYRWVKGQRRFLMVSGQQLYTEDVLKILRENERYRKENDLFHKSHLGAQASLEEKLPEMIRLKEETECDVHTLCRAFEVLRSTYYHRALRSPKKTQLRIEDDRLKEVIKTIFEESKGRFGSVMIKAKMDELGYHASPKRICRLMKEMNLVCTRNRPTLADYKRTYHSQVYYTGDKLKRDFSQSKPNCAWVSDITYLRTKERVYYLCAIIDLFSRKVIGHRVSHTPNTELVISTLHDALNHRNPTPPLIFHSDQGVQYTSKHFMQYLKKHEITQSFSNPGTPYDNAVAESFFATLKKEELYQHVYSNAEELKIAIEEYIQFYNEYRPHYTLGMKTPSQFEAAYFKHKK